MSTLTILDLELLHHYSISTSLTLSSNPIVRNYFLESVPQVGFSHPYVLYSLLALAASHLAHFRPESRRYYYAHARARHTAATSMATPLLAEISTTNMIPMYCFSIMTMFIAFASLRDEDNIPFHDDSVLPSWFALFHGVRTVLEANNGAIYSSSISFLFRHAEVERLWGSNQADLVALIRFQDFIGESTSEGEEARQLLLGVFQDLRRSFYFFYDEDLGNEAKIRSLFTWLYRIPNDFLSLVRHSNSKALCILAFFCVLLHRVEYNWWFQGWGTHLIERIYTALDDGHRFWIKWPTQEIGWMPKRETSQLPHRTVSNTSPTL
ncbi:hypothetical protein FSARC_7636 [Fusarium sarcochroum]|uniref:Sterol uptake control protein 2 n=1 Tax=Fusarium sarcochroum TaxID=1208366 RepID=A0A8H4TUW3_9HYPO|nr:hypothetical protein FSARC_7636 [Fusarium sarcochroum]